MALLDRAKLTRPAFLERVLRPALEAGPVTLTRRRLYILPTRHGLLFALMQLVMLLGSINYANSMGFVLTFLLASLSVVSILHTYRNLALVSVSAGKSQPVFTGQEAHFQLRIDNPSVQPRLAIGLKRGGTPVAYCDIAAGQSARLDFHVPATQRGLLQPGSFSLFPLFLSDCFVSGAT